MKRAVKLLSSLSIWIFSALMEYGGRFLSFFFAHAKWTYPVAALVFLAVAGAGMLSYTENPNFCVTCHVMRPYYDSWRTSSHNFVACIECHYTPGMRAHIKTKFEALVQVIRYINGTYDPNFYAEIDDESCLRSGCHETRLLQGKVAYKEGITFDHKGHLTVERHNIQLRCTSCHSQLVIGSHIAVTEETCIICHFKGQFTPTTIKDASFCTTCHEPPERTISIGPISFNHMLYVERGVECQRCHKDVVRGTGEISEQGCISCHSDFERVRKVSDPTLLHQRHVTDRKVECFECHRVIEHEVARTSDVVATSCDTCHENKHLGPRSLYMGIGGRGVPDMPSTMFLAQVDCIACHTNFVSEVLPPEFGEQTAKPSVETCVTCHGEFGKTSYQAWIKELNANVIKTSQVLSRAKAVVDNQPENAPNRKKLERRIADAEYNYHLVVKGKGIHNVPYSIELLKYSRMIAEQIISGSTEGGHAGTE